LHSDEQLRYRAKKRPGTIVSEIERRIGLKTCREPLRKGALFMVTATFPQAEELEEQVRVRTNRGVRNLSIELRPGRVVLRGQTTSYYVKQLAQVELISSMPEGIRVENSISVSR
jgi:hypothetical protein